MNVCIYIYIYSIFMYFGYVPISSIAESYGKSFWRKFHCVSHSGCIHLHFHQQCKGGPFIHTLNVFVTFCVWIIAIFTGMRWYFHVILFTFPWAVILNIFHMFSGYFCFYIENLLLKEFGHLLTGLLVFWLNFLGHSFILVWILFQINSLLSFFLMMLGAFLFYFFLFNVESSEFVTM